MKTVKIIIFALILVLSFQFLTLSGYNLIKYNSELKESRYKQIENYYLINGTVTNTELTNQKKAGSGYKTYYTYSYKYSITSEEKNYNVLEEKISRDKTELVPTYQQGNSISFYGNKLSQYPSILKTEYESIIKTQDENTYSNMGYVFLGIGLIINVIMLFLIKKSIKKEPS